MFKAHNFSILFCLLLMACAGSGPGAGGGPMDGSASVGSPVGGGNYAAGPVSLPTPATLNKNLIVCENIAGPRVECRGSAGAAPPFAKVHLSVHPAGFSSWREKIQSLFLKTAYAAGFSTIVNASGTGAFTATVEAAKDEIIQIQVGTSRLLLTVPEELSSVSGSTGTMKNMTVDGDGNIWFSRLPSPSLKTSARWTWASLFFGEAKAQETSQGITLQGSSIQNSSLYNPSVNSQTATYVNVPHLAQIAPVEAASCPAVTVDAEGETRTDAAIATRCEVKRLNPSSETPQVVASFPGCTQDDIRFIRAVKKQDSSSVIHSYLLVGIRRSIYIVNVDALPGTLLKRLVFPGEVLNAEDLGDDIYVTLGGEGLSPSDPRIYTISKVSWGNFSAGCINDAALNSSMTVYQGIQSVASADAYNNQFVIVGKYPEGHRVIRGASTMEFIYATPPREIFRSAFPLEAVVLGETWKPMPSRPQIRISDGTYFAVLSPQEKKLYVLRDYFETVNGRLQSRIAEYTFNLAAYTAISKLRIDRDASQLVFIDQQEAGSRLVLIPYQFEGSVTVDLTRALVQDLGAVTPTDLVRVQRPDGEAEWIVPGGGVTVQRINNATLDALAPR